MAYVQQRGLDGKGEVGSSRSKPGTQTGMGKGRQKKARLHHGPLEAIVCYVVP